MKKGKILSLTALMTIALNAPVFATNYTVNATPNIQTRETLEIENGEEQKGGNTQNNKPETKIENPSKKSTDGKESNEKNKKIENIPKVKVKYVAIFGGIEIK